MKSYPDPFASAPAPTIDSESASGFPLLHCLLLTIAVTAKIDRRSGVLGRARALPSQKERKINQEVLD